MSGSRIILLKDLSYGLWNAIVKLYSSDMLTHAYLFYDILYELDRTNAVFEIVDGEIVSYVLIWRGLIGDAIHVWSKRECLDIERMIDVELLDSLRKGTVIHLYISNPNCIDYLREYVSRSRWDIEELRFYDMVVDQDSFKPYYPERACRLKVEHVDDFIKLKEVQARELEYGFDKYSRELGVTLLNKYRYYGLYVDDELIAIACRYLGLRDIGVVGDVYVHPDHRGHGYGKIVTSAITRDTVYYGAYAMLHVSINNIVAIRVYEKLGYRIVGSKTWFFLE